MSTEQQVKVRVEIRGLGWIAIALVVSAFILGAAAVQIAELLVGG